MDDQVPLQSYTEEIRSLIQNERNDEALALCKHVLRYYPKHIETYRLAAEATMESGDPIGAQEIFRRVLSADPEQVVAHAGLAVIFQQERQPTEALWHLERANELAPTNLEIRQELLRLYGEIEDQPRARLKLTPAGLARLYAQEGLYAQAIHEFRTIVDSEPNRFDARVGLAETLWQAGKLREAAEVALHLLDVLPYCLKANLILGATYFETGLSEADTYLQRAQDLDPTNQTAQKIFRARAPLKPAQPMVPRYVPGAPAPVESPAEPLPPREEVATAETPVLQTSIEPAKPAAEDSGLPAWLRADFREMSAPAQPAERTVLKPTLGLKSALPPWLTGLPKEIPDQPAEPAPPAWLTAPAVIESPQPEPKVETAMLPEPTEPTPPAWLAAQAIIEASSPEPKVETALPPESTAATLPEWMEARAEPKVETEMLPESSEPTPPEWVGARPEKSGNAQSELHEWLSDLRTNNAEEPMLSAQEEQTPINLAEILPAPIEPARIEEAAPVEELAPAIVPAPEPPPEEIKPKRKRQSRGYTHLAQARALRDANRVEEALVEYDYVVQKGPRLVNDVIDDLKELIVMWNPPLDAHRILGDAYTRADLLAEALERYRYVLERVAKSD
ncbi:MAG: tetratricopeptide repeat protein [Chloroflexi bacterium]|nr:tetratricopeptide repeat protein [Chloroflexota bacterium]